MLNIHTPSRYLTFKNEFKKFNWKGILLFNFALALLIIVMFCPTCYYTWKDLSRNLLYTFPICIIMNAGHNLLIRKIDQRVSWVKTPVKRLIVGFVAVFIYSTVGSVIFNLLLGFLIHKYYHWQTFTLEKLVDTAKWPVIISFIIITFTTSWSFLMSWRQMAIDAEKLKSEHLKAQFELLKNQVSPHFLFNSFNVLADLVYVDQELAVRFIHQMSQVFRYVLESSKTELVTLSTELEHLKAYVFLLEMRFGSNIRVEFPQHFNEQLMIVPLSLQMLVENAIKHNIVTSDMPLRIVVKAERDTIEVVNNLQLRNNVETSVGMGLSNINSRCEHLAKKSMVVHKDKDSFKIILPLINESNNH